MKLHLDLLPLSPAGSDLGVFLVPRLSHTRIIR